METLDFLVTFVSTFFRFLTYIYLRWVPAYSLHWVLPSLFLVYLLLWVIQDASIRRLQKNYGDGSGEKFTLVEKINVEVTTSIETDELATIKEENSNVVSELKNDEDDSDTSKITEKPPFVPFSEKKEDITTREESPSPSPLSTPLPTSDPSTPALLAPLPDFAPAATFDLRALILSLPTLHAPTRLLSLFFSLLLLLAALDQSFSPLFPPNIAYSRIGAVGSHSVKISYRLPEGVKGRLRYREVRPEGPWNVVPGVLEGKEENDWVGGTTVDGLRAGGWWEYRIVLQGPNPEDPSILHPLASSLPAQTFRTVPDASLASTGSHFTFASTSCIKPGFPYSFWPWRNPRSMPGMRYLKEAIDSEQLEFLMFVGDFIYADTSVLPADDVATYNTFYRNTFASDDFRAVYESIPTLFMYDDHEFRNNFAGQGNDSNPVWRAASSAYDLYLGSANYDPAAKGVNYYSFRRGDVAFFVWDTRRYRSTPEVPDGPEKTMLGERQKKVFYNWVHQVDQTATFKFIISSVPFNTLWAGKDGHIDTWAGFQTERTEIMDVLEHVPNVVVLSGDRHEFAATLIRNKVYEFSTSPLNQFYVPYVPTYSTSHGLGSTGEDKNIKYIPHGNYKFSTFEVDTRNSSEPKLKVKVHIDGKVGWTQTLVGTPVKLPTVTAIGQLSQTILELLTFTKRKWF